MGHRWLLQSVVLLSLVSGTRCLGAPCEDAQVHYRAGLAAKHASAYAEAVAEFEQAVTIDKDYLDAHWGLAWTRALRGEKQLATAEFREVIRIAPDSARAHEAASILQRLGTGAASATVQTANAPTTAGAPRDAGDIVYAVWGEKERTYHRDGCRLIDGPATPMSRRDATSNEFKPCPLCCPDQPVPPEASLWRRHDERTAEEGQGTTPGPARCSLRVNAPYPGVFVTVGTETVLIPDNPIPVVLGNEPVELHLFPGLVRHDWLGAGWTNRDGSVVFSVPTEVKLKVEMGNVDSEGLWAKAMYGTDRVRHDPHNYHWEGTITVPRDTRESVLDAPPE